MENHKRLLATMVTLGLLLFVVGCGSAAETAKPTPGQGAAQATGGQATAKTLKIGSVMTTSGASASMGTEALRGLQYAVKSVNGKGGFDVGGQKYNLELVQYDDSSQADVAVTNIQRLIEQDKVKIIFSPPASTAALAGLKVTEAAKVIYFSTVAAAPGLTDGSAKYSFRNTPTAAQAQAAVVQAMQSMKLANGAILARNDDWGKSGALETKKNMDKLGIRIVAEEYFAPGTKDMYSLLTKVKAQNPASLVVMAINEDGVPLVKQAKELGMNIPIFGAVVWNSPDFLNALGDAGKENIYAYSSAATSKNDKITAFEQDFQRVMGTQSQTYDKNCYDAVLIMVEAMKMAGSVDDTDKIADALHKIQYNGVLGAYSFRPDGQGRVQVNVNKMVDGKPVPVMEIPGEKLD